MNEYHDRMTAEQVRMFGEDVLNIVSQIPRGKVTTYGHIAALAGWPSHSRMVGRTLRYSPKAEKLPCHRVVNKEGRTAPGWSSQRLLLEEEGVTFKCNEHVNMQRHLWKPELNEEGRCKMDQETRWLNRYNEVMAFMEREHRKPSKYYPEEKLMFHFIHHNKKLYNAGSMKAERVEAFEKLLALCEEYKRVNQYQ